MFVNSLETSRCFYKVLAFRYPFFNIFINLKHSLSIFPIFELNADTFDKNFLETIYYMEID